MDIKWKNRLAIIIWLVMLTYGISALLTGIMQADVYLKRNYYQTDSFETELSRFTDLLSAFELNELTREKAKQAITVTTAEIEEHRYRYGDLSAQISNINGQYEGKIQEALDAKNQEIANVMMAERDQKIADITKNFTSDEHVRTKVVKEKEEQIDQYYDELEESRTEFINYKNSFKYYLKNIETGKVYTNLAGTVVPSPSSASDNSDGTTLPAKDTSNNTTSSTSENSNSTTSLTLEKNNSATSTVLDNSDSTTLPATDNSNNTTSSTLENSNSTTSQATEKNSLQIDIENINDENMAFIKTYENTNPFSIEGRYPIGYNDVMQPILKQADDLFVGKIGILNESPVANSVLQEYYRFKKEQIAYFAYTIIGLMVLFVSVWAYKKSVLLRSVSNAKWQPHYMHLPIDVLFVTLFIASIASLLFLTDIYFYYENDNYIFALLESIAIDLFWGTVFVSITLLVVKILLERIKDRDNFTVELKKSFVWKSKEAIELAFLNRRVGTQMMILLAVVFGCGFGAIFVGIEPVFLVIYIPVVLLIGVPLFLLLMKRTGYFNQIVQNTSQLASGNFEPDLPIKGKSILAKLAENINSLKHGVKVSQKAQAKSERLKTELITNVSHDLRTPLTSIITYTELLKTPNLSEDERDSYIEIIDRKSKRLKVLIDDLFEASKMASGNMELVKEKVDLVQLLQQTLAENDEAIRESGLQFRISKPDTPVYAYVDGQKLWRVFDNLIGNILKYSLENTRVYISMKPLARKVEIDFKNVAKYELGGDVDELFERFKRGDTSRHTEGSGLGLAIAKSIVDLHEGSLDIYVDGDLFKVTITLEIM